MEGEDRQTEVISVRLPTLTLVGLKDEAKKQHIPFSMLAKIYIINSLETAQNKK